MFSPLSGSWTKLLNCSFCEWFSASVVARRRESRQISYPIRRCFLFWSSYWYENIIVTPNHHVAGTGVCGIPWPSLCAPLVLLNHSDRLSARSQKRLRRLAWVAKTQTYRNIRENNRLRGNMETGCVNSRVFRIRSVCKKGGSGGVISSSKLRAVQFSGVERSRRQWVQWCDQWCFCKVASEEIIDLKSINGYGTVEH